MVGEKLALWEVGKKQLCGCSLSYQAETLEGPPGRISRLGAPRSGINFNRQGAFPSEPRKFQRDPGSLGLSYRANEMQGMCARGCSFPFETDTTP